MEATGSLQNMVKYFGGSLLKPPKIMLLKSKGSLRNKVKYFGDSLLKLPEILLYSTKTLVRFKYFINTLPQLSEMLLLKYFSV